jgi:protein-S-isoprenylcysteine O-methyltransferase Ste14
MSNAAPILSALAVFCMWLGLLTLAVAGVVWANAPRWKLPPEVERRAGWVAVQMLLGLLLLAWAVRA